MLLPTAWVLGVPAFYWFTAFVRSLAGDEMVWATWAVISIWFVYVGVWNLMVLRKPEVIEAFGEKREL